MSANPFWLRKKYWLDDFLHGAPMWKQYSDVMKFIKGAEGVEKRRQVYLNDMLTFAKEYVPFYNRLKETTALSDFPVMNKQDYLSDYKSFCTPEHDIPYQKGKLHIQKTSGSTGTPFAIPQDTRCRLRRIAIIKGENEKIDFHSFEPMMHLRAVSHYWGWGEDFRYASNLNIWYVDNSNMNPDKIVKIVNTVNENKIKVIRGYMTSLDMITRYMEDSQLTFYHKVIFISVGELLQDSLRNRVVNYLHCQIISQYGNEENGILGQSDLNGSGRHINLNGANCIVEILKLDEDTAADRGELGRIVVTDFTNYAFPMIRYEIGDLAAPCEFYSDGTVKSLDNLSGRITDMITRTDGEYIDMFNAMPFEIYNNPLIRQYQFIQQQEKQYVLKILTKAESVKDKKEFFIRELKGILGEDAKVQVEIMDELPVLSSGKRRVIINEWRRR